jgi:hypothetical protein
VARGAVETKDGNIYSSPGPEIIDILDIWVKLAEI